MSEANLPAVLCVDDDPFILDGFRRQLRKKFRVHIAVGPYQALDAIAAQGPFAIIVSDFQMPGMDGIQFLTKARALAPQAVRIMLTGQADFSTAMAAVNQGNIFRFLIKPCTPLVLEKVLDAAIEQHNLLNAERQLTEETLLGCVQVLIEVLGIAQPEAFSRASRVRRYVRHVAGLLGYGGRWELDAAAMLSQIGWITLPPDLLAKAAAPGKEGAVLSDDERQRFLNHASAAARILNKIPRLGLVAQIVERQHTPYREMNQGLSSESGPGSDLAFVGAQMLNASIEFDALRNAGLSHDEALARLRAEPGAYMPSVVEALTSLRQAEEASEIQMLPVSSLTPGMILEEELRSTNDLLLFSRGQEITSTFVERLHNYTYGLPADQTYRVRLKA